MARERPALSNDERGLTLVETLVSMAILFIVFIGLMETARMAVDYNVRMALRDEAVRVAEEQMNVIRSMPFNNAVAVPPLDNVSRTVRKLGVTYRVARTVTLLDANTGQVNIRVAYDRRAGVPGDNTISFTTIVRRPATP